ncbi:MAG TPA: hypothetical protein VHX19_02870 [Stellaceae bacterium]|jgi:hypothetical protein|nr:hypothetical protein [Stellaceae bacterium]
MGITTKFRATKFRGAMLGAAAIALALAAGNAKADPIPPGGVGQDVKVVGFSSLGNHPGGFKIAIKHTKNDKWYLFSGQSFDQGWSIVDVTDPAKPRYVKFIPFKTDDKSIITAQVTLHDNLMITSLNSFTPQKNPLPAVLLWDISDPENPKQVGSWQGGDSGAHRNSYPGGKYAYLSTSYPGFKANILVILDVSDPAHPKEVGKWWQPGQKDGEPPAEFPEGFHGPANVSPDGKMISTGYTPDVINLDISDPTHPKLIGKLHITEPFASVGMQSVHTVLPYWDRKLLYVSSEAQKPECKDNGMNFAGFIDNSDPAHPRLISVFPPPLPPKGLPYTDFCEKGGRFGPHNTSQEIHNTDAIQKPNNLMEIAWFNAGLRVFDVADARQPTQVGYFIPPERKDAKAASGAHASPVNWSEEIAVDTRGNIYMNDDKWGLWIMRYTGKQPAAAPTKAASK